MDSTIALLHGKCSKSKEKKSYVQLDLKNMYTVYRIRNIGNSRYYIGSTINFEVRKSEHLGALRSGKHTNVFLQADFRIWGEKSFEFSIIQDDFKSRDKMLLREYELILKAGKQAYNIHKDCPVVGHSKKSKSPKYSRILRCRYFIGKRNHIKKVRAKPIKVEYPVVDSILERKRQRELNKKL